MQKASGLLVVLAVCGLLGCNGGVTHDKVAEETIAMLDKLSETLEKSTDAKDAEATLKSNLEQLKELRNKADSLEPLTFQQDQEFKAKNLSKMEQAMMRYKNAVIAFAKKDPEGAKSLEPLFSGSR